MPKLISTDGYANFLRHLSSVILGLKTCSASLDREVYAELTDRKKDAVRNIRTSFKLDVVAQTYFDVSAGIILRLHDSKTGKEALMIECTFEGHFHGKQPISREYAERFASGELRVVVWPYFRQFISDTTTRMSINPIFLPMYVGLKDSRSVTQTGKVKPANPVSAIEK